MQHAKLSPFMNPFEEEHAARCVRGHVVVIDDDANILKAVYALLELEGYACETHASAEAYLHVLNYNSPSFPGPHCVLCDMMMPGLNGLELQSRLAEINDAPLLLMSGGCGIQETADGFRAGALDFLVKPIEADILLAAVAKALDVSRERQAQRNRKEELALRVASLSERELSVARQVVQGRINVEIAQDMSIALRTVKHHRQRVMEKLQVQTVVELVRVADEAGVVAKIRTLMTEYGISAADLDVASSTGKATKVPHVPRKKKVATKPAGVPKYLDPVSGKTWTGTGKPPAWIVEGVRKGQSRDDFLISKPAPAPKADKTPGKSSPAKKPAKKTVRKVTAKKVVAKT